ncbi:LemA family protein [Rippkaea orientalis PCC 8801]|uniref:LemA family protein n=1 Tax=Rippkaea orientalis (strain PCC 8801 / RF-1) TaxID=41431 RepID=B7JWL7_RIPO1|nr:LemA family protein [Rippkaea orientalis]ACK68358.1 LemA family protein [Rippkaea orientalis PCC 8801]
MPQGKVKSFITIAIIALLGVIIISQFLEGILSLLVFLGIPLGIWLTVSYNKLQGMSQRIKEAHSNIMVSMKKRVDLANKLIDITSSYGDHEKLTHITIAQQESVQSAMDTSQQVDGALNRIISLARAYPELQANQTYQMLMQQLENIEVDLQLKREFYNASVREYNIGCTSIPIVFIAGQLGFKTAPYFDIDNADTLENLKDFQTDDGKVLTTLFSQLGQKVVDSSKNMSTQFNQSMLNSSDRSSNDPNH